MSTPLQIPVEGVPINSELDVKVEFVAPESPGRYISYWRMASSNGLKFGQRVWVLIHVLTKSSPPFSWNFVFLNHLIPFFFLRVAWSG